MSFSNTQLTKNMLSRLLRICKKIIEHVIFKYAINKKHVITIITNSQKNNKTWYF